jgi:hypothetical protein
MSDEFSVAEIEAMRKAVRKHDSELDPSGNHKEPYVHQEFPKIVYDHDGSEPSSINRREENGKIIIEHVAPVVAFKVVKDADELKAALKEGFSEEPAPQHPEVKEKAAKAPKPKAPKEKAAKGHEDKK